MRNRYVAASAAKTAGIVLALAVVLAGCQGYRSTISTQPSSGKTAGQEIITLHVNGLSCPFCVLGLEKKLKQIPHISVSGSEWSQGEIYLRVRPGQSVTDEALREAVTRAGFTPGIIERREDQGKKSP